MNYDGIKGIIFDYGGTLDTGGCHWGKAIWHAYERNRVPVSEEQFREAYVYAERELAKNPIIQPDYTFKQTLAAKLKIELCRVRSEECGVRSDFAQDTPHSSLLAPHYHQALLDDLYAKTQAVTAESVKVLRQLRECFPMVLVSNFYGNIATVLREFGFDGLFDSIIESAVVGVRKPDPRIFTLGVETLGMKPGEVLVVGDSYDKDIVAAKRAGCRTAWMKGEGWTDDTPDGAMADVVISRLDELLNNQNK